MNALNIIPPTSYFWISIEGADRVGKTTLLSSLVRAITSMFSDFEVIGVPEVSNSYTGTAIRAAFENGHFRLGDARFYAQLSDALLWFADQHSSLNAVLAKLSVPTILVSDRGPDSRKILQELKLTGIHTRGNTEAVREWIQSALQFLPQPNITLVLSASFDTTKQRMKAEFEYERYMLAAKKLFDNLAIQHPTRVVLIDAENNIENVLDVAMSKITSRLLALRKTPNSR